MTDRMFLVRCAGVVTRVGPLVRRGTRVGRRITVGALVGMLVLAACSSPGSAPAADQGRSCLTGALRYQFADAEAGPAKPLTTAPARDAGWELWGATGVEKATHRLAAGRTDPGSGAFRACADGPVRAAEVRFDSTGPLWRVVRERHGDDVYSFATPGRDLAGTVDLGPVQAPADIRNAWHVADTLTLLYARRANPTSECWTRHQPTGHCDLLTVVWEQRDTDDAGYWDLGDTMRVILAGAMTDSKHLVLHEAGHWWQWQLHNHTFPDVTGCDNHMVDRSSSRSCAWTEGFADAVAAYTLGDQRYVDENGGTYQIRNDRDTRDYDAGDTVQGRVGACLLDLWAPDGPDGGNWDRTVELMTRRKSADFRAYFMVDRPAVGLGTTGPARAILTRHTITY
ncbi:hypothetical protein Lfu02_70000 [Longispora fulva]|uniref:Metalloprotease n=1 Tax=Longispora fulva TaxID=619741 RepID=A0A8J7GBK0_9ACTN|nr:hypothetical protein [Longispora fulva]MBG6134456.1 hypothetical protein [Longispora fulva]GIG62628.1 hypothetical protein Lfu02_70000 [Longispora fulva]